MPAAHCLQIAGLVVGFVRALLVTVTQRPGGISDVVGGKESFYVVMAYPRLWRLGLCLLSIGFVIQLIGEVL